MSNQSLQSASAVPQFEIIEVDQNAWQHGGGGALGHQGMVAFGENQIACTYCSRLYVMPGHTPVETTE